jgi:acyl-coenzyme A thioesterase PaaI-like protein
MCFGAGPANDKGLRMEFYADDERVYSETSVPFHMNSWQGLVHGGIVSTILDEIMFYTAVCFFKCIALTKEVTVRLHKPARFDQMPFTAVGEIQSRIDDTNATILGRLFNDGGELCAESLGTFALIKSHIIRRLEILTEADIRMIDGIIEKIQLQQKSNDTHQEKTGISTAF